MFTFSWNTVYGCSFRVAIRNCPINGIPAIDFRKNHKLPLEASNIIDLKSVKFDDEQMVRRLTKDYGDLSNTPYIYEISNGNFQVYPREFGLWNNSDSNLFPPSIESKLIREIISGNHAAIESFTRFYLDSVRAHIAAKNI